ncbi:MAG: tRNA (adenosine(37)-N6)-threonylcarbamoyltransferase complex transferase subunit TsaD [Myxococcales bacterium]|nr:tRNA (adenosine(37)-N6)-threonylcarbamoyltransferase complex transferase subunit TsaD [Myxococcales bacterium]
MNLFPILAVESSCDETAVAILGESGEVMANEVSSQDEVHAAFGGVVPEIAAREHIIKIAALAESALDKAKLNPEDVGTVAATYGPGLIGPLMVGLQFAKGFAQAQGKRFIGIHHIEGHLMAAKIDAAFPKPPFLALIVSGGHSALYQYAGLGDITTLGETRDDAAGEAFDKIAKLLGLGYPGGRVIDERAKLGDPEKYKLPISLRQKDTLDYSFSGLKTAVRLLVTELEKSGIDDIVINDVCASAQKVIVQALLNKAFLAAQKTKATHLVLGGGVSANSLLRANALKRGEEEGISVYIPPKNLCTDNALMIALAARERLLQGQSSDLTIGPQPGASVNGANTVIIDGTSFS